MLESGGNSGFRAWALGPCRFLVDDGREGREKEFLTVDAGWGRNSWEDAARNRSVRPWDGPARRCIRCAQMTDICALWTSTISLGSGHHGLSGRLRPFQDGFDKEAQ